MNHKKTQGKFGEVHYWISSKQEETMVFIHGAMLDHGLFSEQIAYFSKNYTVITVDVPWHGLSVPYDPFSLKNAADDVVKILKEEGITQANFIGQSMGGLIAQIIGYDHPTLITSLTVIGSAPLQRKYYVKKKNMRFERFVTSLFTYNFLTKMMAKKVAISTQGRAYVLEVMKKSSKSKLLDIMMKIPANATQHLTDKILDVPILITYGDKDETEGIKTYCNQWAENENRELKVIKNSSHNANLDNPRMFNEGLNEFLLKNKKGSNNL